MLDAALGRTPREAEEGMSCIAGRSELARPCKLINNSISIGMATLMAEAFSTAAKAEVDLAALCDVAPSTAACDG
jgi:3-hydroxyisobutyrate dehydrogenase-like beta-hydroxyacid dehydrogenase